MGFAVPPGDHAVELTFEATPLRKGAAWGGALGVVLTGFLAWAHARPAAVRSPEAA
ncbi:MAG: hypothetical protein HY049_05165 [Acidobacteria bacterium]|nr:hypothetical protein [Acidobacteriota bacterium]